MCALCALALAFGLSAQTSPSAAPTERTVEESYLQESLEGMIIREQSRAESRDMKKLALTYIGEAIDAGRLSETIEYSLHYLVEEGVLNVSREAGTGRIINNFPDIREKACEYLGNFNTDASRSILTRVLFAENEPSVLGAAIRSLVKISKPDDMSLQAVSFIINRFDILKPDNSLAYDALVAFEAVAERDGGIKDSSAVKAIMLIAEGNYITPVKDKAKALLRTLREYSIKGSTGKGSTGNGK
jgi:hypothetical protein